MAKYVVVAEDDADIALVVADVLETEGYEVATTMGAATLAIIRGRKPDIALLDYQMPGMDGVAIAETMRGEPDLQDIPIVAMTAATRAPDICRRMQAAGCIGKPFDVDQLITVVHELIHTTHRE